MRERAKSGARTKKARGGGGGGADVGGLSILIGQFWLFRQQVSRRDGISSFSIVMTACSFENVLKLKPQQYSSCSISKIFRRKKLGLLAVNKKSTD